MNEPTSPTVLGAVAQTFSNGRLMLLIILGAVLVAVTVLSALHDIDSESTVTILSAIIGGAIGHANGNLQGKLSAQRDLMNVDRERLIAAVSAQTKGQP